jgi:hypothetical protein
MNNSNHIRDNHNRDEGWTGKLKDWLSDYKTSVPGDLWNGINAGMEKAALPAGRKIILRRLGIVSAIAAAALFGVFFGYKALSPGAMEMSRISSSEKTTIGKSSLTSSGSSKSTLSKEDKSQNASLLAENENNSKDSNNYGSPAGNAVPISDSLSERKKIPYTVSDSAKKNRSADVEVKKNSVSVQSAGSGNVNNGGNGNVNIDKHGNVNVNKDVNSDENGKETTGDYIDSYPVYLEEKKSSGISVTAGLFAAGMSGNENSKMGEGAFMMGANPLEGDNVNMVWAAKGSSFLGNSSNNMSDFTYHHKLPVKMGVMVKFSFFPGFFVGSGLSYSRLYSNITSGTSNDGIKGNQVLHYLGLPLNVSYDLFERNRFAFYCTGGGSVEKCISGKVKYDAIYGIRVLSSTSKNIKINHLQWSLNAALGFRADLSDYAGLYVEPGISYHFDNGSSVTTIYKDRPLDFSLTFGLCFYFK